VRAVNRRTGELVTAITMAGSFYFGKQLHHSTPESPLVLITGPDKRAVVSQLVLSVDYSTNPRDIQRATWGLVDAREGR
jgi:hypothetical protein